MKKVLSCVLAVVLCLSTLAGCDKKAADNEGLTAAKDMLFSMYKDKQGTTASDFERPSVMTIGDTTYTVTWSTNVTEGVTIVAGDKMTTIDVNEESANDIDYVLTATIADAKGNTVTQEFTHKVPAYKLTSWAEYVAAKDDDVVIVSGVVTAVISKTNGNSSNCLYFEDADGAYYAYNMSQDPVSEGIVPGMTVKVTGKRATYSGQYEITDTKVEIVDSNVNLVTPEDYTDKFLAAADLKDASITEKQGSLVTLKGVVINPSTASDEDSGYYKFTLGEKISYARISSSVCPIVLEKDTFINDFKAHTAYKANVTGIICLYDGAFYLTPVTVDAYEYLELSDVVFEEVEPEADMGEAETLEKAFALEHDQSLVGTQVLRGTITEIVDAYSEQYGNISVNMQVGDQIVEAWRLVGGSELAVGDTITVAGTLKRYNDVVEFNKGCIYDKDKTVDEMKMFVSIEAAKALEGDDPLSGRRVLAGEITEIVDAYSDQYNNVSVNIKVGDEIVEAWRLKGGADLKVGDVITVTGYLKKYGDIVEFNKGCEYVMGIDLDAARAIGAVTDAFAMEDGDMLNYLTTLTGTITEVVDAYSAEYKNISVNMQLEDGSVVEAWRLKGGEELKVGDVITVTGYLKKYGEIVEFNKGCTYTK